MMYYWMESVRDKTVLSSHIIISCTCMYMYVYVRIHMYIHVWYGMYAWATWCFLHTHVPSSEPAWFVLQDGESAWRMLSSGELRSLMHAPKWVETLYTLQHCESSGSLLCCIEQNSLQLKWTAKCNCEIEMALIVNTKVETFAISREGRCLGTNRLPLHWFKSNSKSLFWLGWLQKG